MALEAGLSQLGSVRVLGAFYYPSRPMSRDTGFKVEDVQQDLFEPGGRKQNRLTLEQKKKLFDDGRARIKTAIDGIRSGQFAPKPHDLNECSSCRWRTLCRAPHLN
jgi:hypothetical protein